MAIDISGIFIFMQIFSFLFVFLITYAVLLKTKVLGENNFINILVGFIMAIIFLSYTSLELYVQTLVPWFVVLLVCVFLVLLIGGFSSGKLENIMNKGFGWVVVVILIIIFLIAAIRVFNPVFHPDLIITSGEGTSLMEQIFSGTEGGQVFGIIVLLITAIAVAFVLTRKS